MTKHLEKLMEKEMTRKEFIATLGFGMASLFGMSAILRLLTGQSADSHLQRRLGGNSYGYGGGPYGGSKNTL